MKAVFKQANHMDAIKKLFWEKRAKLLDSKYFLLKSFFALSTAYLLFKENEFLSKDMISLLFGLMLTLEPVNLAGVKNAFEQLSATVLGAIGTAMLVSALGINFFTVGLSMALTIYIALKINWRMVPVVAVFSSIYMTQYVQLDLNGNISMVETFKLRMGCLITGVVIALFFNYIFSLFTYNEFKSKRVKYILILFQDNIKKTSEFFYDVKNSNLKKLIKEVYFIFNEINWIRLSFEQLRRERKDQNNKENLDLIFEEISLAAHYHYDLLVELKFQKNLKEYKNLKDSFEEISRNLENIFKAIDENKKLEQGFFITVGSMNYSNARVKDDYLKILNHIKRAQDYLKNK